MKLCCRYLLLLVCTVSALHKYCCETQQRRSETLDALMQLGAPHYKILESCALACAWLFLCLYFRQSLGAPLAASVTLLSTSDQCPTMPCCPYLLLLIRDVCTLHDGCHAGGHSKGGPLLVLDPVQLIGQQQWLQLTQNIDLTPQENLAGNSRRVPLWRRFGRGGGGAHMIRQGFWRKLLLFIAQVLGAALHGSRSSASRATGPRHGCCLRSHGAHCMGTATAAVTFQGALTGSGSLADHQPDCY